MKTIPNFKVANLSTAHLPQEDYNWLMENGYPTTHKGRYGLQIVIPADPDDLNETPLSPTTHKLIQTLREEGFDYAMFDQDGNKVKEFPLFDW